MLKILEVGLDRAIIKTFESGSVRVSKPKTSLFTKKKKHTFLKEKKYLCIQLKLISLKISTKC